MFSPTVLIVVFRCDCHRFVWQEDHQQDVVTTAAAGTAALFVW